MYPDLFGDPEVGVGIAGFGRLSAALFGDPSFFQGEFVVDFLIALIHWSPSRLGSGLPRSVLSMMAAISTGNGFAGVFDLNAALEGGGV